jgi:hypothetical protein
MLVKVAPLSVESCTCPKSHGQPAPPFVSLSESCICQNESLIVFDPAGTPMGGAGQVDAAVVTVGMGRP